MDPNTNWHGEGLWQGNSGGIPQPQPAHTGSYPPRLGNVIAYAEELRADPEVKTRAVDDIIAILKFIDVMPTLEIGVVLKERGRITVNLLFWLDYVEHKEGEARRQLGNKEAKADIEVRPTLILQQKSRLSEKSVQSHMSSRLFQDAEYQACLRDRDKWVALKGIIKAAIDVFNPHILAASAGYFRKEM